MKWLAVIIVTILMVAVWVVFISVVIQGEEATISAERLTEKTSNAEFNRHLLEEDELISDFTSTKRKEVKDNSQMDNQIESSLDNKIVSEDPVRVVKVPEVKNGDAIGYGEGISIDDLLTQSSDNN